MGIDFVVCKEKELKCFSYCIAKAKFEKGFGFRIAKLAFLGSTSEIWPFSKPVGSKTLSWPFYFFWSL